MLDKKKLLFALCLKLPSKELWRDLSIVAVLQLAALGYGVWTVFQVRPIYLVHEVDRFKVVTPLDIDLAELSKAKPEFQRLPLHGIRVIGVQAARDGAERLNDITSEIFGKDISAMPGRWQKLDADNQAQIRVRTRDVAFLRARTKDSGQALDRVIADAGLSPEQVIAVPLVSQRHDWTVSMDRRDLRIIGYLPIDAF